MQSPVPHQLRRTANPGLRSLTLCFFTLFAASTLAPAAPAGGPPEAGRPRVGLVLSGGGARGLAHIGVLKALQQLQVPVDLVVGTSMGAVVGGAYAAGRSVEELEQLVRTADWTRILADRPARPDLSFRRREEDRLLASRIELGLDREGLLLPSSAAGNSALEFTLERLAPNQRSEQAIDQLALPFQALATDLVNGRLVVLKDTPLNQAMRASMAVPGLFSPVRVKGRLLVDGGLVRNLGVDVARAMGADVIIAVNVGSPLLDEQEIQSALSVTDQMIKILTTQNVERSLEELGSADILLTPEMSGIGLTDFESAERAIDDGLLTALAASERLRALALPAPRYALHEERRRLRSQAEAGPLPLAALRIQGSRFTNPQALQREIDLQPGQSTSRERIQQASAQLYGRGDFERVQTQVSDDEGHREVVMTVTEAAWARSRLRMGIELASDFKSFNRNTLSALHTLSWLNSWGAELRSSVKLGSYKELKSSVMQPLGPGSRWYVEPSLEIMGIRDNESLKPYQWDMAHLGFALGRQLGPWGDVQLAGLRIRSDYRDADYRIRANFGVPEFRWRLDSLDAPAFPSSGRLLNLALRRYPLTVEGQASTYQLKFMQAFRRGEWAGHIYGAYAGSLGEARIELPQGEGLGGFLRLSGSEPSSKTQSYALTRVVLARRVGQMPVGFGDAVRAGFSLELGQELAVPYGERNLRKLNRFAASGFIAVDSRFGPVYLALGATRDGGGRLYFFVGPVW
ncbi:patatin-like phospholipase family protein [Paucibacter sp. DJ1R-11]|uniref:patatin-like phospholipase family protein n=1 Tax=Paucibacter sp. DJ1R-11 TaxID=2893556 RepID=UPI0021E4C0E6|nr:patatin-like phospholipase family protein [Paucibacter sp. DJ1R-11]MCV2365016.1 patatin-like phospholipase family protein [Paucibacter sp. DJ1R-11]